MNFWNMLGIKPTTDISEIKKAYAQQLKIYHPEDDPIGYQKLRSAFDLAKKTASLKEPSTHFDHDQKDSSTFELNHASSYFDENIEEDVYMQNVKPLKPVRVDNQVNRRILFEQFMRDVAETYQFEENRNNVAVWAGLFSSSDIIWNYEFRDIVSRTLFEYFSKNHYLSDIVFRFFEDCFQWREKILEQDDNYQLADDDFFEKYLNATKSEKPLAEWQNAQPAPTVRKNISRTIWICIFVIIFILKLFTTIERQNSNKANPQTSNRIEILQSQSRAEFAELFHKTQGKVLEIQQRDSLGEIHIILIEKPNGEQLKLISTRNLNLTVGSSGIFEFAGLYTDATSLYTLNNFYPENN